MNRWSTLAAPLRNRRSLRWLVFVVALLAVGASWTLSSPPGSSPDDTFHVPSIWCSATADDSLCTDLGPAPDRDGYRDVEVPIAIGDDMACFRYNYFESAGCQTEPSTDRVEAQANDDLYPEGYYWLMGPLASTNVAQSVAEIRIVNWIICFALLIGSIILAVPTIRRTATIALVATSVPLSVFLFASNNPSGIVVAAIPAAWIGYSSGLRHTDRRKRNASLALATFATVFALFMRSDAGIYVVISLATVVMAAPPTVSKALRIRLLTVVGALALVGIVVATITRYPGAGVTVGMRQVDFDRSLWGILFENLQSVSELWTGAIGDQPLGWLDTPVPQTTRFIMTSIFVLLVVSGIVRSSRAARRPTYIVLAALFVIPMYLMALDRSFVGEGFQARYLLPLLPILAMCSLADDAEKGMLPSRRALLVGVSLIGLAHTFALHANIRRYVTGIEVYGYDLDKNREWWWGWGPSANGVWVIGSIAFVVAGWALFWPREESLTR